MESEDQMSMRPAIDHTLLSRSGKCSKRARKAFLERERARLFPPGYWDKPEPTGAEKTQSECVSLRRRAKMLSDLADRGMKVRKYRKEAAKLLDEAAELERKVN
jgi:hypothetical protein